MASDGPGLTRFEDPDKDALTLAAMEDAPAPAWLGDDMGVRAPPPAWFGSAPSATTPHGRAGSGQIPIPCSFVEAYIATVVEPQAAASAASAAIAVAAEDAGPAVALLPLMDELAKLRSPSPVRIGDLLRCKHRPHTPGGLHQALLLLNGTPTPLVEPRQARLAAQRERDVAALAEGWGCPGLADEEVNMHLAWLLLRSVGVPKDALPTQPVRKPFVAARAAFQATAAKLKWNCGSGCC